MIDLPITVKRQLTFGKRDLKVALRLDFTGNVNSNKLVEQLPFLKKAGMKLKLNPGLAIFTNSTGRGITINLDRPLKIDTGLESHLHQQTIGSLLINLGAKHKKGDIVKLNYTLSAI